MMQAMVPRMSDPTARLERVDASLAKQLRASMQRNACLVTSLHMLREDSKTPPWISEAIRKILIGCDCVASGGGK